ncbi:MAG: proline iminopeptidase-family hydrolase [Thermoplasmata archaeon]|nr:proline iminopeptidase-family hydrolase [Thermoplasmata archaeon]
MTSTPEESGFVPVLGVRLYVERYGTGTAGTLLAVHGGPGVDHRHLRTLADLAPHGIRVVLYDQAGCGRSDRPRSRRSLTFQRAIEELEALRKALRLGPVHLLGYSYGAAVAVESTLRSPRSVRSLILSSPFLWTPEYYLGWKRLVAALPPAAHAYITRKDPRLGDSESARWRDGYAEFFRRHEFRGAVVPFDLAQCLAGLQPGVHRPVLRSMAQFEGPGRPWDVGSRLARLRCPCLVTVGRHDKMTPSFGRALTRKIRGARLQIFEQSGHHANWEERAAFQKAILEFLSSHR